MIKALTGVYKINAGSIMVDGKPQQFNGTLDAQTPVSPPCIRK